MVKFKINKVIFHYIINNTGYSNKIKYECNKCNKCIGIIISSTSYIQISRH